MRVAAIYDIHANLPALEAVIEEIREIGVDQMVVGGDVLPGPMPRETIECLLRLDIPTRFIYGNGEVAVLEQMAGREPAAVPEAFRPIIRWNAEQLSSEHRSELAGWPATITVEIPDLGEVLFCHATPRNENEIFTRLTAEEKLLPVFEGWNVVVCGHTHMQFDRMVGRTRVVNAGSVGMPFGAPGAYWLLLGPGLELRRTDYDLAGAAGRVRGSGYPQAEEFAERNIQRPPSEEEILQVFSKAELRENRRRLPHGRGPAKRRRLENVGGGGTFFSFLGLAEERVYLFERSEKSHEGGSKMQRAGPYLREIAVVKLARHSDYGGAHGPIFLRSLRPGDPLIAIHPQRESH